MLIDMLRMLMLPATIATINRIYKWLKMFRETNISEIGFGWFLDAIASLAIHDCQYVSQSAQVIV